MKLLYSTQNQGKLKEARDILASLGIEFLSTADFPQIKDLDVEETGDSFAENAFLKAKTFAQKTNTLTIAEDFGLEVEALNGEPGVHSKRWLPGSETDKNKAIIEKLKDQDNRSARYVIVVCLYNPDTNESELFEAEVKGQIATEIKGAEGFGYDPIFIPDGYDQTFAELGTAVKNKIGHRALALKKVKQWLQENKL